MKSLSLIVFLLYFAGCSLSETELVQSGEAIFRITLNYGRELTDAEIDSIERSHPFYMETTQKNELYDLLVRKGIVTDQSLDTSGLNFSEIALEEPMIFNEGMTTKVDTSRGREYLTVNKNNKIMRVDLGPVLLGDRYLSYVDIDDNGNRDLLLMEKSYVIGGYNFNLKLFKFDWTADNKGFSAMLASEYVLICISLISFHTI